MSRNIHPSLLLLPLLSASTSAQISTPAFGPTTILSDTFDNPSYDIFNFNSSDLGDGNVNFNDISTASFAPSSDGNPGAALEITHFHELISSPDVFNDTFVQSFLDQTTVLHTPSIDGVISTINFSIDLKTSDPFSNVFFTVNDAGGSAAGFTTINTDGDWHTVSVTGLTASDFGGRDFSGSDPLNFGFGFFSSLNLVEDGANLDGFDAFVPESLTILADNFTVSFTSPTSVPEPSSSLLAGLAILGLSVRRRRSTPFLPHPLRSKGGFKHPTPKANS